MAVGLEFNSTELMNILNECFDYPMPLWEMEGLKTLDFWGFTDYLWYRSQGTHHSAVPPESTPESTLAFEFAPDFALAYEPTPANESTPEHNLVRESAPEPVPVYKSTSEPALAPELSPLLVTTLMVFCSALPWLPFAPSWWSSGPPALLFCSAGSALVFFRSALVLFGSTLAFCPANSTLAFLLYQLSPGFLLRPAHQLL
ncbi:proteoglycan 4-like protein [Labeo rohita]|uniref:Proteoglycan 4-like protein n=1 Tax=Labeo rohita TaxID=84645 RepID=A0A498NPL2_LABRO|nr:proteoglycan 4-like protein [Labeo rohita]